MRHLKHITILLVVIAVTIATVSAKERLPEERKADKERQVDESKREASGEAPSSQTTAIAPGADAATESGQSTDRSTERAQAPQVGEEINWWVIGSGGGSAASTSFQLSGTVGQAAVGQASSTSYGINQGFWQDFGSGGSGCCVGTTGNVNDDPGGNVDLPDVIYLVNALFLGGPAPPCPAAANVNGDAGCNIDLPDVIYLVNALFLGGPAPAACLPGC
ncbi:hypothetical protein GF420_08110 [candidate division GN15 bacterium]|nr:hypothetical protein [candidate division GN15 bacterium]